ncbi:hypothetical protein LUZ61_008492 [Rhynchospora tenuis]|uniref:BTB domain-containing protein n=1 Tax=Rhynchospora tenuis TaxID=198213 RepID=A0AAD6EXI2_9POAL|nr:hypothetical protein LUZ61_008492 [Rhynchospora tenuis]
MEFFPGGTITFKVYSGKFGQGEANEALLKVGSFERMFFDKYGPFTVGDTKFEIRVYPVGREVQIHFCFLSGAELVKELAYMFLYLDDGDIWKPTYNYKFGGAFKADSMGEALGLHMRCIQTFSADYTYDLKLVLWCILDDLRKVPVKPNEPDQVVSTPDVKPQIADPNQPKICSSDFTALLTGEFADIRFVVDGQIFPAHRAVLAARSSVLRSEFLAFQDDLCQKSVFVSIQQHIDAFTFKNLLHFIYTDSLPADFDEPTSSQQRYHRLFIAAHLFNIQGLKKLCEEKLTVSVAECILSALDLIDFQDSGLLKIVQKDCDRKPDIITSPTN